MTNQISKFLKERIDAGDFPSAVYMVAERGVCVASDALGNAVAVNEKIKATHDTIYDLASLTKPLVTGLLCAKLIEQRRISLSDSIAAYFEEFDSEEKRKITVKDLLTHTSGLAAWKPLYLIVKPGFLIRDLIAGQALEYQTGSKVVYSDLNFILLGLLIENLYGKRLDEIAAEEIFDALALPNTGFNPPQELRQMIAASENGNAYERQMCTDLGYKIEGSESSFRDGVIWGEVHDGNCCFLGGVAGHAGLFSNVIETSILTGQFLPDRTRLLQPKTCSLFSTNFTPGLNEARSVGFQLAKTEGSSAGDRLADNSFGHTGFTGTSVWIEPDTECVFILLTNRTHARELPFAALKSVQREFHSLAVEMLERDRPKRPEPAE